MKTIYLTLLYLTTSTLSHASGEECLNKIKSHLKTPSERYLFANRSYVSKHFSLECKVTEYGDGVVTSDAMVLIHEAAHFEDFQVEDDEMGDLKFKSLNLYTINNAHIGNLENTENLPTVSNLINPYLEKNKPTFLEEGAIFLDHHDGYIGTEDAMAAQNLQGMSTETNGYTHGTVIQARLQSLIPDNIFFKDDSGNQHVLPHPLKNKISQAEGLYYFLYNFNLYLRLLKEDHPLQWKKFYSERNKIFLRKLFNASITTLKSIRHCDIRENDEGLNFYITELGTENLEIMKDLMGSKSVPELTCANI